MGSPVSYFDCGCSMKRLKTTGLGGILKFAVDYADYLNDPIIVDEEITQFKNW